MALTRERILETSLGILRAYGLADLSMRRLAQELDVAPGALYYHVRNKQELLNLLAARILQDPPRPQEVQELSAEDLVQETVAQTEHLRACLLEFPDAADVVGLALALAPDSLEVLLRLQEVVAALLGQAPSSAEAERTAQSIVFVVLGFVRSEQDRSRALGEPVRTEETADSCRHGVRLVLDGLGARNRAPGPASGTH